VTQDHIFLALAEDSQITPIFKAANVTTAMIQEGIKKFRQNKPATSKNAEQTYDCLNKYAVDLVSKAEEGKLDPVIGRDDEIRRVIRILSRRQKNNPVLVGEPGVGKKTVVLPLDDTLTILLGKTAVAEGLAQRIVKV